MILGKIKFYKLFSKTIADRNEWVYYFEELFHSLIFLVPIWIVYYQARLSPAQISILFSLMYLSQMMLELPSGALADMIGRRMTAFIGLLVGAAAYLLIPSATSFEHFIVLFLMIGLSDSFRSGSIEALLYDTFKEARDEKRFGTVYANGNVVYQIGLVTSTAVGGFLFGINQHLPYYLYGISLFFSALATSRFIEPKIDSAIFTVKNYISQIVTGSKEAFKNQYAKHLSLFYIFVGGIAWSSTLYFNEYLLATLIPLDSLRGIIISSMRLINIVVIMSVLKNKKLFNWQRTVIFFPIVMLVGYLPGYWLNGVFGAPFVELAMIATTARWVILAPLTNEAFSSKYRATAISLLSLLIGFVYIGLTTLSAVIIPIFGIKAMYSVLGFVSMFTVLPLGIKLLKVSKSSGV